MTYKKYKNKKVECYLGKELIKFDSKAEAKRGVDLFFLQKTKLITSLVFQPEFILQEGFRRNSKAHRAIKYIADFQYKRDGVIIVEDVKGKKTAEYQTKKKLFIKRYGDDLVFYEVYIKAGRTEMRLI